MRKGLRNSMSQDNCYSLHSGRQRRKKGQSQGQSGFKKGKGERENVRRAIRVYPYKDSEIVKVTLGLLG